MPAQLQLRLLHRLLLHLSVAWARAAAGLQPPLLPLAARHSMLPQLSWLPPLLGPQSPSAACGAVASQQHPLLPQRPPLHLRFVSGRLGAEPQQHLRPQPQQRHRLLRLRMETTAGNETQVQCMPHHGKESGSRARRSPDSLLKTSCMWDAALHTSKFLYKAGPARLLAHLRCAASTAALVSPGAGRRPPTLPGAERSGSTGICAAHGHPAHQRHAAHQR